MKRSDYHTKPKQTKIKLWKKITLSILGILVLIISGLGIFLFKSYNDTVVKTERTKPLSNYQVSTDDSEIIIPIETTSDYLINFLIMGVDNDSEREVTDGLEGTRTDSLMLVTLNTKTNNITIYSIPRDTTAMIYDSDNQPVDISGQSVTKINAAYEYGGELATINTVEHLFSGINIDYYGTINFISFKGIVDSLGGIEMNVPEDIYALDLTTILVHSGEQTLSGTQALDFARARYQDNDIKRGYRQQLVMQAILEKMLANISATNALGIFNSIQGNVKTDMDIFDMKELYSAVKGNSFTFTKIEEPWGSYNLNGSSMVYLNGQSRQDIVNKINESIERAASTEATDGTNEYQNELNKLSENIEDNGITEFSTTDINKIFSN